MRVQATRQLPALLQEMSKGLDAFYSAFSSWGSTSR